MLETLGMQLSFLLGRTICFTWLLSSDKTARCSLIGSEAKIFTKDEDNPLIIIKFAPILSVW